MNVQSIFRKSGSERGSVQLEFILIAPVLFFLIFGILQFSLILTAKELTRYAAYSAARATLVYNEKDYKSEDGTFYSGWGPLFTSASTILSWMVPHQRGKPEFRYYPADGEDVWEQVWITGEEHIPDNQEEGFPIVSVTVHYYYPMMTPIVGTFLAWALNDNTTPDDWQLAGWLPQHKPAKYAATLGEDTFATEKVARLAHAMRVPLIHLQQTCRMVKPYSTASYPLIPQSDTMFYGE